MLHHLDKVSVILGISLNCESLGVLGKIFNSWCA
uniref:Uncharacterized protein n=1 Tax=Rhizophora mucronata TaxID=61149 RepID=A0A2P2Q2X1_RHIMU